MPAAPPSNMQGYNNMGYNPMMSGMPNMVPNMGYSYPYPVQAPYYPQFPPMMPQAPSMFGTPPQMPGMGMIPQVPFPNTNISFPEEPIAPRNMNSSFESTFDRDDANPILVDDGK